MKRTEMQGALARLAKHRIGPHEAAALFAVSSAGSTAAEIAAMCEVNASLMRVRLAVLVDKGLIDREQVKKGEITYYRSVAGNQLIIDTLGLK